MGAGKGENQGCSQSRALAGLLWNHPVGSGEEVKTQPALSPRTKYVDPENWMPCTSEEQPGRCSQFSHEDSLRIVLSGGPELAQIWEFWRLARA